MTHPVRVALHQMRLVSAWKKVMVWDLRSRKVVADLRGFERHGEVIRSLAMDHFNHRAFAAFWKDVYLWNFET